MAAVTAPTLGAHRRRYFDWRKYIRRTALLTVALAAAGTFGWATHSVDKSPVIRDTISQTDGALQFIALAQVSDAMCDPSTSIPRNVETMRWAVTRCTVALTATVATLRDGTWPYNSELAVSELAPKLDAFIAVLRRAASAGVSTESRSNLVNVLARFTRPWLDVHEASATLRSVLGIANLSMGGEKLALL